MSPRDADLQAQLAALRAGYVLQLPAKFGAFEKAFDAFLGESWTEPVARETYRLIHSLAGSTGTYGFPELSELARTAEAVIKASVERRTPLLSTEIERVREALAESRDRIARLGAVPTKL